MAKASAITETAWKGPVQIMPLGWGLTATFVVLFVFCFLAALAFPNVSLAHSWLGLFSTREIGFWATGRSVIWNVVFAWIAAVALDRSTTGWHKKSESLPNKAATDKLKAKVAGTRRMACMIGQ